MGDLNRYTLDNPSDDYEFQAPDDEVAEAVTALISGMCGWTAIVDEDGDDEPRSGGFADLAHKDDADEFIAAVKATATLRRAEVVAALRSLEIKPEQRKRLGVDPEVWHDEMRTSMSDFRASALQWALRLEAMPSEPESVR